MHINTYIHTYIHTYTHTYTHTYIHTYSHAHTYTNAHPCIHCNNTYVGLPQTENALTMACQGGKAEIVEHLIDLRTRFYQNIFIYATYYDEDKFFWWLFKCMWKKLYLSTLFYSSFCVYFFVEIFITYLLIYFEPYLLIALRQSRFTHSKYVYSFRVHKANFKKIIRF